MLLRLIQQSKIGFAKRDIRYGEIKAFKENPYLEEDALQRVVIQKGAKLEIVSRVSEKEWRVSYDSPHGRATDNVPADAILVSR